MSCHNLSNNQPTLAGGRHRAPRAWVLLFALLALALPVGCGGGAGADGGAGVGEQRLRQVQPGEGIRVMEVDFLFTGAEIVGPPSWRIEVEPEYLTAATGIRGGYLNVVSAGGWAIQNLPVAGPEEPAYAIYCDLGIFGSPDQIVRSVDLQVIHTNYPVETIRDRMGKMEEPYLFELERWTWDAQGIGDLVVAYDGSPDPIASVDAAVALGSETYAYYQRVTNEQTAQNQCMTMALANALQFLEDQGALNVPHNHGRGLKGDSTLVGKLDTATNRPATSRSLGDGLWFTPLLKGLFKYLKDNKRVSILNFRHQGRGYGTLQDEALAAGNHTSNGSTSTDDGAAMTFDWILTRLRAGSGIVAVMRYDLGGGHAVRITGCGRLNGRPWVRYSHDAMQTASDSKDQLGIENVLVWLEDTDQDNVLNFGDSSRELCFLFALGV